MLLPMPGSFTRPGIPSSARIVDELPGQGADRVRPAAPGADAEAVRPLRLEQVRDPLEEVGDLVVVGSAPDHGRPFPGPHCPARRGRRRRDPRMGHSRARWGAAGPPARRRTHAHAVPLPLHRVGGPAGHGKSGPGRTQATEAKREALGRPACPDRDAPRRAGTRWRRKAAGLERELAAEVSGAVWTLDTRQRLEGLRARRRHRRRREARDRLRHVLRRRARLCGERGGRAASCWKHASEGGPFDASIAIHDLDGDGDVEILAADSASGRFYCLDGKGEVAVDGEAPERHRLPARDRRPGRRREARGRRRHHVAARRPRASFARWIRARRSSCGRPR